MSTEAADAISLLIKDHKEIKKMFNEYEQMTDRSVVGKKKLADKICAALTLHTQVEEEIFYPAVRKAIDHDDLMDEALVEHAGAKILIAQIKAMNPGDDLYDAKVKVLSEQVRHHIEEEECEMFPKVRKAHVDLSALGKEMKSRQEEAHTADVY